MRHKTFEEYEIGETFTSHGRTIGEADIVNFTCFAGLKLPLFIDDEFCRKHTPFDGRIAPGFMTASITAGMMEDILGPYTLAALSLDGFVFTIPVRPGDTIHARITVENKRETSDGKRGILTVSPETFNQRDERVLRFRGSFLMRKGEL